jgi:hypothetical protein
MDGVEPARTREGVSATVTIADRDRWQRISVHGGGLVLVIHE